MSQDKRNKEDEKLGGKLIDDEAVIKVKVVDNEVSEDRGHEGDDKLGTHGEERTHPVNASNILFDPFSQVVVLARGRAEINLAEVYLSVSFVVCSLDELSVR